MNGYGKGRARDRIVHSRWDVKQRNKQLRRVPEQSLFNFVEFRNRISSVIDIAFEITGLMHFYQEKYSNLKKKKFVILFLMF